MVLTTVQSAKSTRVKTWCGLSKPKDGRRRKTTDRQERTLTKRVKIDPTLSALILATMPVKFLTLISVYTPLDAFLTVTSCLQEDRLKSQKSISDMRGLNTTMQAPIPRGLFRIGIAFYGQMKPNQSFHNLSTQRPKNKRYDPAYAKSAVKFVAGSLIAWGRLFP